MAILADTSRRCYDVSARRKSCRRGGYAFRPVRLKPAARNRRTPDRQASFGANGSRIKQNSGCLESLTENAIDSWCQEGGGARLREPQDDGRRRRCEIGRAERLLQRS